LLWCALLGSLRLSIAAEAPPVTISKSDAISVSMATLGGSDGAAITKIVQSDLAVSGYFTMTSSAGAAFVVAGTSSGEGLQGKVTDHGRQTVVSRTYSGDARSKAHQFSDDIIETLTGTRGFANTKIAFVATRSGRKEIYVADANGSNVQQITRDNNISVAPALSPDGRRLAYTGYKSGYADVYEINLGSGARERIVKFPGTNSGAAFSPDGGRIALTLSKDGNPELYTVGAGGGGARRLTQTRGVESSPTWSPDSAEIIYSSDDRGSPQLYRISSGGGSAQMLPAGHSYCTEPNWSPDGKKVAFSVREGGEFQVAVLELQGGGSRVVSGGGDAQDPVWAADSRHLFFCQSGGLYLLDVQTGRKTKVLDGLGKISEPSSSR
ncbi:MAG: biopolymer transporter Tol, partial [Verrucomicrobiota bacterium]|nr:biopolymer transporter Tol [Verrucomicrobiota bacterium]